MSQKVNIIMDISTRTTKATITIKKLHSQRCQAILIVPVIKVRELYINPLISNYNGLIETTTIVKISYIIHHRYIGCDK